MTKAICKPAVLHLVQAALKVEEVPVGNHDCSGLVLTATIPELAVVARAAGTLGDGYDLAEPAPLTISPIALLLFMRQFGLGRSHLRLVDAWAKAIRLSLAWAGKPEQLLPPEAKEALALVQAEQPAAEPARRRTPAKRVGAAEIDIAIRRVPKSKSKAS